MSTSQDVVDGTRRLDEVSEEAIQARIGEKNRRRGRAVGSAIAILVAINIVIDLVHFVPQGDVYYLFLDLAIQPMIIGMLLVTTVFHPSPTAQKRWFTLLSFLFMAWGAVLITYQSSPYTIFVLAFILGAALLLPPLHGLVTFFGAFPVYLAASRLRFHTLFAHSLVVAIEILALLIGAWLVSALLYRQQIEALRAQEELRALASAQEAEIRNRTADLQHRLEEREVLVQEIHHRVKNNLQILASLLRLTDSLSAKRSATELLKSTEQRILSMALVHQQLYDTDYLEQVEVGEYFDSLVSYIMDSQEEVQPIEVVREIEGFSISVNSAVNLGLIVTEVLSNALHHAFDRDQADPTVHFSLLRSDKQIEVRIRDNGKGIYSEALEGHEASGLGLVLVDTLASQLNGTVSFESDHGTVFTCLVPLEGDGQQQLV